MNREVCKGGILVNEKVIRYRCPNCGKYIQGRQREDGTILASCPHCKGNVVSKKQNVEKQIVLEIKIVQSNKAQM